MGVWHESDATPGTSHNFSFNLGHNGLKSSTVLPFSLFSETPIHCQVPYVSNFITLLLVWMQVTESQFQPVLAKSETDQLNPKEKLRSQTTRRAGIQPSFTTAGAQRSHQLQNYLPQTDLYFSRGVGPFFSSATRFSPHLGGNVTQST